LRFPHKIRVIRTKSFLSQVENYSFALPNARRLLSFAVARAYYSHAFKRRGPLPVGVDSCVA
jgi:hypothetical protein